MKDDNQIKCETCETCGNSGKINCYKCTGYSEYSPKEYIEQLPDIIDFVEPGEYVEDETIINNSDEKIRDAYKKRGDYLKIYPLELGETKNRLWKFFKAGYKSRELEGTEWKAEFQRVDAEKDDLLLKVTELKEKIKVAKKLLKKSELFYQHIMEDMSIGISEEDYEEILNYNIYS